MPRLNANEYDAIIIVAGIGGRVYSYYLANAGKRLLIADQSDKPGCYWDFATAQLIQNVHRRTVQ